MYPNIYIYAHIHNKYLQLDLLSFSIRNSSIDYKVLYDIERYSKNEERFGDTEICKIVILRPFNFKVSVHGQQSFIMCITIMYCEFRNNEKTFFI